MKLKGKKRHALLLAATLLALSTFGQLSIAGCSDAYDAITSGHICR